MIHTFCSLSRSRSVISNSPMTEALIAHPLIRGSLREEWDRLKTDAADRCFPMRSVCLSVCLCRTLSSPLSALITLPHSSVTGNQHSWPWLHPLMVMRGADRTADCGVCNMDGSLLPVWLCVCLFVWNFVFSPFVRLELLHVRIYIRRAMYFVSEMQPIMI